MKPVEFHFDEVSMIHRFILPRQQSALSSPHVYEPPLIFKIVAPKFRKRTLIPDLVSVGNITIKHFSWSTLRFSSGRPANLAANSPAVASPSSTIVGQYLTL